MAEVRKEPHRRRLPDERKAITHEFNIGGHEGHITVGLYEDGTVGEIFLDMAKGGSTVSGFADLFSQSFSMNLQYGAPLEKLVRKFKDTNFEPNGRTKNPEIPEAKSVGDYLARWLELKFLTK